MAIPDLDGLVLRACHDVAVVKAKIQDGLRVGVVQFLDHFACGESPDDYPAIATTADYDVIFWTRIELQA